MLARAYAIFIGVLLIVMAIAGYRAPQFLGAEQLLGVVPTIWLLTGLISLVVGLFVRNLRTLQWYAGIVGIVYLLWGLISLFTPPGVQGFNLLHVLSMITISIGAFGLAAALSPAFWMHETYPRREAA